MRKQPINLGTFEVISGVLRISDPCYDKKTWCAGTVGHALEGTWKAQVIKDNDKQCRELVTVHSLHNKSKLKFKKLDINVGVDSGCAGIFDDRLYGKNFSDKQALVGSQEYDQRQNDYIRLTNKKFYEHTIKFYKDASPPLKKYYQTMIDIYEKDNVKPKLRFSKKWNEVSSDPTFGNIGAGVIRNGVVSRSGDGDGSYVAYAAYDKKGRVVGVKIKF